MLARSGSDYRQYGKTGWAACVTPQVGWYVGYVETYAQVWLFALNLEVRSEADLALREQLALASLRSVGVLPDA
jgi:beta-lactamase class D